MGAKDREGIKELHSSLESEVDEDFATFLREVANGIR
jgi:hypothetical protein